MQVSGAVPGASIPHPRRRRNVLLAIAAIVVIAAVGVLVVWVPPFATDRGVTEDALHKAGAGSAVVHDDAGNVPTTGAGSAVIHDEAGDLNPR
jgi:type II secretory pathway component PulM